MGFFSLFKRKKHAEQQGSEASPKMKKGVRKKKKKAKGQKHNLSPEALREQAEAEKALRKKKKAAKKKKAKASRKADVKLAKEAKKKRWSLPSKLPRITLGGKRKVKDVKADPIDEDALGFTFKSERKEDERREAVRVPVDGLDVRVDRVGTLSCVNISATGVAFRFNKARFKYGVELNLAFIYDNKVRTKDVNAKVIRHEKGVVGCVFENLDHRQDDVISKFLLIGQKQQAARRNKS